MPGYEHILPGCMLHIPIRKLNEFAIYLQLYIPVEAQVDVLGGCSSCHSYWGLLGDPALLAGRALSHISGWLLVQQQLVTVKGNVPNTAL